MLVKENFEISFRISVHDDEASRAPGTLRLLSLFMQIHSKVQVSDLTATVIHC